MTGVQTCALPILIKIYNTLTQTKEEFKPLEEAEVRIYVCGITTYDYCHLGHARMLVAFDMVVRHLRVRGYEVTYVRNITDIDDKILSRARENGDVFSDLTEPFITAMHADERALSILPPDQEPRATAHIDEIIAMIDAETPLTPVAPERPGEVARRYRYVDGGGEIGVIASVTHPFCHDCDRMRLAPDGQLYTCLFASDGHNLRALLAADASDDELRARLASIWRARSDRYSEERGRTAQHKVEMSYIGG